MPSKSDVKLELRAIIKEMHKQNSPARRFIMAMLNGAGNVIGATIVASLVFLIVTQILSTINTIPVINSFIKALPIEEIVETETSKR